MLAEAIIRRPLKCTHCCVKIRTTWSSLGAGLGLVSDRFGPASSGGLDLCVRQEPNNPDYLIGRGTARVLLGQVSEGLRMPKPPTLFVSRTIGCASGWPVCTPPHCGPCLDRTSSKGDRSTQARIGFHQDKRCPQPPPAAGPARRTTPGLQARQGQVDPALDAGATDDGVFATGRPA